MARGNVNSTDYGAIWFVIDHRLGIRHSHLNEEARTADLGRYNVLILPDRWGATAREADLEPIKEWVRNGGTLIAVAGDQTMLEENAKFSKVRELSEVLGKLPDYELAVLREWLGQRGLMPAASTVWEYEPSVPVAYPWQAAGGKHPEEPELKKRDAWQRLFMPQGALLAARVNTNHWLTFGCGDSLPLYAADQPILMAAQGVEAPVRYGLLAITNAATVLELVSPPPPKDKAAERRIDNDADSKPERRKKPRMTHASDGAPCPPAPAFGSA
jgi:hypothetical protein